MKTSIFKFYKFKSSLPAERVFYGLGLLVLLLPHIFLALPAEANHVKARNCILRYAELVGHDPYALEETSWTHLETIGKALLPNREEDQEWEAEEAKAQLPDALTALPGAAASDAYKFFNNVADDLIWDGYYREYRLTYELMRKIVDFRVAHNSLINIEIQAEAQTAAGQALSPTKQAILDGRGNHAEIAYSILITLPGFKLLTEKARISTYMYPSFIAKLEQELFNGDLFCGPRPGVESVDESGFTPITIDQLAQEKKILPQSIFENFEA